MSEINGNSFEKNTVNPKWSIHRCIPIHAHKSENIQTMTQPVHGFTQFEICRWNGCAECRNRTNHQIFAHSVFVLIMHPFQWISIEIRLGNAFNMYAKIVIIMYAWVCACFFLWDFISQNLLSIETAKLHASQTHIIHNTFDTIALIDHSVCYCDHIVLHFNVVFSIVQRCVFICVFDHTIQMTCELDLR